MTTFYNWSGGMESSAMLVVDLPRIKSTGAIVQWADTGKHFPEMADNKRQVEKVLGIDIVTLTPKRTFDQYLFEPGPKGGYGILRKGIPDCSRKMKREALADHCKQYPQPWEINIGFNAKELARAEDFANRNETEVCKFRFPLIEHNTTREDTIKICQAAGFTVLVGMYEKMGRFDCFWCPNQTLAQAAKVIVHYPELAREWSEAEKRKGHSFLPIPLAMVLDQPEEETTNRPQCSCFGGEDGYGLFD